MSGPRVRYRPSARRDLRELAQWLREEADAEVARRIIAATRQSFGKLASTPGLGAPAEAKAEELKNARRWQVQGYPNYLIFYEPTQSGVTILRVLHAAQDWKRR